MLNRFKHAFNALLTKTVSVFARLGLTPNSLTIIGFLLALVSAFLIFQKLYYLAAIIFLFSALFDALDGALARLTNRVSRFGGVLDSVIDRYVDSILILSIWWNTHVPFLIASLALVGSLLTSYTRARLELEQIGSLASIGIVERPERILLLFIALLFISYATYIFFILAILSNITVIQRLNYGRKKLSK
ncbi:hypothetical protein B9Q11_00385 [Candidatus Marsarchaeota G2 archaeon ECH_B_SAG-F08]|jgi:archaetidylinositol phosphate synthase|uniref:Archaetidylinositol phosphate synthase n=5 Tax=Candidatus Marsarchaeota TaxID=1978152 RepID=A0A2R6AKJ9_9ARCH|nr:MAG: hypothetical protein B9Q02_00285 [Candidatus Marsarchaeota G1 archaeon BE_D]PSN89542.1 MAG: hypothetical protein B9Q00_00685 [Candidatus Marsarchaeota G1 archaeon OSP_C]PSN92292.1 MAG: hypothetical protein B9P99_03550 [Candidatus Marsarchaeota G1 archaeon OSP_B]PSN99983.1 MAG: hypothetical protein B9Q11_00385 [Candidatus Marsarchaeota G2 archaeon ECH_B_SAG-F08]PSO05272.1 MAG: hypothetical protein B9Q13_02325 [Candidatus Marsarchaeota G2 archaeon ECH_B_SAG-G16]